MPFEAEIHVWDDPQPGRGFTTRHCRIFAILLRVGVVPTQLRFLNWICCARRYWGRYFVDGSDVWNQNAWALKNLSHTPGSHHRANALLNTRTAKTGQSGVQTRLIDGTLSRLGGGAALRADRLDRSQHRQPPCHPTDCVLGIRDVADRL